MERRYYCGYSLFCRAVKSAKLYQAKSFKEGGSTNGKLVAQLWHRSPLYVKSAFDQMSHDAESSRKVSAVRSLQLKDQKKALLAKATFNLTMKWVYACPALRRSLSDADLARVAAATTKHLSVADRQRVKEGTAPPVPKKVKKGASSAAAKAMAKRRMAAGVNPILKDHPIPKESFWTQCVETPAQAKFHPAFQAFLIFKKEQFIHHQSRGNSRIDHFERSKDVWVGRKLPHFVESFKGDLSAFEIFCKKAVCAHPALHMMVCDPIQRQKLGKLLVVAYLRGSSSGLGKRLSSNEIKLIHRLVCPSSSMNIEQASFHAIVKGLKAYLRGDGRVEGSAFRIGRNWEVKGHVVNPSSYAVSTNLDNKQLLDVLLKNKKHLPQQGNVLSAYQWGVLASNPLRTKAGADALSEAYREFGGTGRRLLRLSAMNEGDDVEDPYANAADAVADDGPAAKTTAKPKAKASTATKNKKNKNKKKK